MILFCFFPLVHVLSCFWHGDWRQRHTTWRKMLCERVWHKTFFAIFPFLFSYICTTPCNASDKLLSLSKQIGSEITRSLVLLALAPLAPLAIMNIDRVDRSLALIIINGRLTWIYWAAAIASVSGKYSRNCCCIQINLLSSASPSYFDIHAFASRQLPGQYQQNRRTIINSFRMPTSLGHIKLWF